MSVEGAIRVGSFRSGLSGVFGGSAGRSKRVSRGEPADDRLSDDFGEAEDSS